MFTCTSLSKMKTKKSQIKKGERLLGKKKIIFLSHLPFFFFLVAMDSSLVTVAEVVAPVKHSMCFSTFLRLPYN